MSPAAALLCLPLLIFATSGARSQEPGDAAAGGRLVERWCSECHGLSFGGAPVPTFAAIAAMPSTTALSLGVFLRTSHPTMPNVMLGSGDLDDVIAYILSLR